MSLFRNYTHGTLPILLAAAFTLSAQEFRGTLTGTVADPSGATIGNAQVQAINQATQQNL